MDTQTQQTQTTEIIEVSSPAEPQTIERYLPKVEDSKYTSLQKETIFDFINLAHTKQWSLAEIGTKIGCSTTVVHRLLSGTYPGKKSKYIEKLAHLVHIYRTRMLTGNKLPFIETKLARWIMKLAETTQMNQYASIVIGESQWGKTEAIKEYARRNPEYVVLVRCPVSASPVHILKRICEQLNINSSNVSETMIRNITRKLTCDHLLIIDEIHHILDSDKQGRKCIEQLREIYDITGCGLFLVATPVFAQALKSGHLAGVLKQLSKRNASHSWVLPNTIADEDLRAIWTHYEFPKPTVGELNVIRALAQETGFGMFIKRIVLAYQGCKKAGLQPTWADFATAHRQMKDLEKGIMPEDF